jgi:hypothetical protein
VIPGVEKYVGPSSGFSLARLAFARADKSSRAPRTAWAESSSTTNARFAFTVGPTAGPSTAEDAIQLSQTYFEHIHAQYPVLHQPSHLRLIEAVYSGADITPISWFKATMVLAVSASILSKRLRIPFSGEGLCASAMQRMDEIDFQNSLQGVQCLVLLTIFTFYNPSMKINPWYLNYQCLAAVLDLGLQRDIPSRPGYSHFDREMRTRTFWAIYSIDRVLATAMGRPIGLRDEACELRLPANVEDGDLDPSRDDAPIESPVPSETPGPISCSCILFRLAQMNSEIKYIMHSISRDVPTYTYPQIPDMVAWQSDLHHRLQILWDQIPNFDNDHAHLSRICQIRYHEIVLLLFRPSPRFRKPSKEALETCYRSGGASIQLWKDLYDANCMSYSWLTVHSICLSAITMLYSIWSLSDLAASIDIGNLMVQIGAASNLLTAAGEHWIEARQSCRNLEVLSSATVHWLLDLQRSHQARGTHTSVSDSLLPQQRRQSQQQQPLESPFPPAVQGAFPDNNVASFNQPGNELPSIDTYVTGDDLALFFGAPDPFATDFSLTMDNLFSDCQPSFDLGI